MLTIYELAFIILNNSVKQIVLFFFLIYTLLRFIIHIRHIVQLHTESILERIIIDDPKHCVYGR